LVIGERSGLNRVELSASQVREGRYELAVAQPDLSLLLTFYQGDNSFVGETRYLHTSLPPMSVPAGRDPMTAKADISPAIPRTETPRRIESIPITDWRHRGTNERQKFVPSISLAAAKAQPMAVPSQPGIEPPPDLGIAGASNQVAVQLANPPLPVSRPVVKPVTFLAPVPLKRVSPVIPPGARPFIREDILIRVAVDVDSNGKVTDAHPLTTRDGLEKLLAPHAVQAAKLWQFRPARRDGEPVAGETTVVFHFTKE
jgi:hypothetical protein